MNQNKTTHEQGQSISGMVQSGIGKGCFFTSVDWVVRQCKDKLGYAPFPGTLNVRVCDEDLPKLAHFLAQTDTALVPSDKTFCSAPLKKIEVSGISAAIVLPSEDVRVHDQCILEIISPCSFKQSLGLKDGDRVKLTSLEK
jgi:CTP-dependent riboflavin kinase